MRSIKFGEMLKEESGNVNPQLSLTFLLPAETEKIQFLSGFAEFHQTIIIWHIATELCYGLDHDYFIQKENRQYETAVLNWKMSKSISRYMMYLLAISPETFPSIGAIGQINFNRTCDEGRKEIIALFDKDGNQRDRKHKILIEASKRLYERHKDSITGVHQIKQQLSGSLLPLGCVVAKELIESMRDRPEEEVSTCISV
ncbi:hypothetical protein D5086_022866 [Populus alba]|uniref:Uncharacterized protein n=1 Tax=Populus alba TaxID=43335 RepID=A0ACC4B8U9_POPAL